jgi:hypothetical protein
MNLECSCEILEKGSTTKFYQNLLKHIIEGNIELRIEVMGIRERIRKQLLDDLNET